MGRYKTPRDSRAGISYAAANFDIAIAIVRASHNLSPEIMAEVEAVRQKLQQQTHSPQSSAED